MFFLNNGIIRGALVGEGRHWGEDGSLCAGISHGCKKHPDCLDIDGEGKGRWVTPEDVL